MKKLLLMLALLLSHAINNGYCIVENHNNAKLIHVKKQQKVKDSYRGQISEKTGRQKNVYVKSYTRKDGTRVNSHYRSSPKRKK